MLNKFEQFQGYKVNHFKYTKTFMYEEIRLACKYNEYVMVWNNHGMLWYGMSFYEKWQLSIGKTAKR